MRFKQATKVWFTHIIPFIDVLRIQVEIQRFISSDGLVHFHKGTPQTDP